MMETNQLHFSAPSRGRSYHILPVIPSCRRTRSALDGLRSLLERGHLKPVIDSAMPLAEVAHAHKKLEEGGLRGKIVLSV